ncbi:MAG: putative baseplate assembly protein [Chlorobia bacterium]|nr:putative baseplate assembly protein [Fimbriimonadaceae bacterium]
MALPSPNLDDRSFQSLVDDAKRMIGLRCPEWTDHNVSDPGVTLIELFSYLSETMLFRLNQVPEKNHIRFLDMLGVRLQPAEAAQTDLRFSLSRWIDDDSEGDENEVELRGGSATASTLRTETEDSIEFVTDRTLRMIRPRLRHVVALPRREAGTGEREASDARAFDLPEEISDDSPSFPIYGAIPGQGDSLYVGFENDISNNVIHLYVECLTAAATGLNESYPAQMWEIWHASSASWRPLEVVEDRTFGFNRTGYVELAMPDGMVDSTVAGTKAFWIRVRYTTLAADLPPRGPEGKGPDPYQKPPEIKLMAARTVGGTVSSTQCSVLKNEPLGISDGLPGQTFQVRYYPTLGLREIDTVLVGPMGDAPDDMDGWVPWIRVDDFSQSDSDDRHFTYDELTGTVAFGPVLRNPDGTTTQFGRIPEQGLIVGMSAYRIGGGVEGNVRENKITITKGSYQYISGVSNPRPATGGRDMETLDRAIMRAKEILKIRNRAVTADDFEFLAQKATGGVGRARCVQPMLHPASGENLPKPGTVRMLIVPALGRNIEVPRPEHLTVSPKTIEEVLAYLDEHKLLTTVVEVSEPDYVFVSLDIRLVADPRANSEDVSSRVRQRLNMFLHPLYGGPSGDGWPFRRSLTLADIYAQIGAVRGVAFLLDAKIFTSRILNKEEGAFGPEEQASNEQGVRLGDHELFCTRAHTIRVVPITSVGSDDYTPLNGGPV